MAEEREKPDRPQPNRPWTERPDRRDRTEREPRRRDDFPDRDPDRQEKTGF